MATDTSLPLEFRKRVVCAAWLRSKLLDQENELDNLLVKYYPQTKTLMAAYQKATQGQEKRFILACLVLTNFGMSPYLSAGVERHGEALDEFDSFHTNYWIPSDPNQILPGKKPGEHVSENLYDEGEGTYNLASFETKHRLQYYSKPLILSLLTAAEKKQVIREREIIYKNHPSKLFGGAIIDWAKSHPKDPKIPHMLYMVVKFPRWSGEGSTGPLDIAHLPLASQYSRAAFMLLHKQYPTNTWTNNADVWY